MNLTSKETELKRVDSLCLGQGSQERVKQPVIDAVRIVCIVLLDHESNVTLIKLLNYKAYF